MATCNLCPPGSRDIPDEEMAEHLRSAHPGVDRDGTHREDGSTIIHDYSLEPAAGSDPGSNEWRES
jgi:hypothetical protein